MTGGGSDPVVVRHSKNPAGPVLVFAGDERRTFIRGVEAAHVIA
ncbi:DUF397 domain-containing protein [Thermopolyspora sp. NPDC052614]